MNTIRIKGTVGEQRVDLEVTGLCAWDFVAAGVAGGLLSEEIVRTETAHQRAQFGRKVALVTDAIRKARPR